MFSDSVFSSMQWERQPQRPVTSGMRAFRTQFRALQKKAGPGRGKEPHPHPPRGGPAPPAARPQGDSPECGAGLARPARPTPPPGHDPGGWHHPATAFHRAGAARPEGRGRRGAGLGGVASGSPWFSFCPPRHGKAGLRL